MKVGDLVRLTLRSAERQRLGIVVSEIRHGANSSSVDVLIEGQVLSVICKFVEVINESR
jgi:septum formation topological specificity factor MinE